MNKPKKPTSKSTGKKSGKPAKSPFEKFFKKTDKVEEDPLQNRKFGRGPKREDKKDERPSRFDKPGLERKERSPFEKPAFDRPKRSVESKDEKPFAFKKSAFDKTERPSREKPAFDRPKRSPESKDEKPFAFKKSAFDKTERSSREKPAFDRPKRSVESKDEKPFAFKKSAFDKAERPSREKPAFDRPKRSVESKDEKPLAFKKSPFDKTERPSREKPDFDIPKRRAESKDEKPFAFKKSAFDKTEGPSRDKPAFDRPKRSAESKDEKPFAFKKSSFDKKDRSESTQTDFNRFSRSGDSKDEQPFGQSKPPFEKRDRPQRREHDTDNPSSSERKTKLFDENYFLNAGKQQFENAEVPARRPRRDEAKEAPKPPKAEILRLNKFVAQSGICSRRKAAELVKAGEIYVNGEKEINPAYETKPTDVITYKSEVLKKEEKLIYLLMNKPKNVITSADDEKGRRTVLDLLKDKYEERVYPVGRLDRNTTGLLLLTNDGNLTKKLSHPSHLIKKIYHVELDKPLTAADLNRVREGITLEDGLAEVDSVDYISGGKKNEIGVEIHSGKNRIVRRIFESLGYDVVKLDRTYYAGLTKKDLPRGFSRELDEKEIIMLRHFTNQRRET